MYLQLAKSHYFYRCGSCVGKRFQVHSAEMVIADVGQGTMVLFTTGDYFYDTGFTDHRRVLTTAAMAHRSFGSEWPFQRW